MKSAQCHTAVSVMNAVAGAMLMALFSSVVSIPSASAQCDTNQGGQPGLVYRSMSDTNHFYDKPGASYKFEMHYDSSRTVYHTTEWRLNSVPLHLVGWCDPNLINDLPAAQLADSSRTSPFDVSTGDTISLYRELYWRHDWYGYDIGKYTARDTLEFVVELVDASTGDRHALLDSIGLLRRTTLGSPTYYGLNSSAATISYVIPPALDSETVVMRMKLYVRGDGPHYPIRSDGITLNLSDRINRPAIQAKILTP